MNKTDHIPALVGYFPNEMGSNEQGITETEHSRL